MPTFRIRTKQTAGCSMQEPACDPGAETYLGPNGVWSPVETAIRFRNQQAAERALMEEWNRLRNAGNKHVILSVVRAG